MDLEQLSFEDALRGLTPEQLVDLVHESYYTGDWDRFRERVELQTYQRVVRPKPAGNTPIHG